MIGDVENIAGRIRRLLPRWFGPTEVPTPVLTALLAGIATAFSGVFALIEFARQQARIATATGGWLDLIAQDFFGRGFPRFRNEPEAAYRTRLRQELFRQRNTRAALDSIVFDLTGQHPRIFEGFFPADTGGWGSPQSFAWGGPGRWGSQTAIYEVIITMPYPQGYGIPNRGGWGSEVGGWGTGNFSWVNELDITGSGPTVADILNRIDQVRAAGITVLVRFVEYGLPY